MKEADINKSLLNTALKRGDPEAYQLVFNKYYEHLFNFINFYTNNSEQSKDIIQETFVKLWQKRAMINKDMSILAFLHKVAYNIFIDNYRRNKREKAYLDKIAYERLASLIIEDEAEKNKRISKVMHAISELPPRCKEVFKMSKLEGYQYTEIAKSLNISVKTVEVQIGKAFSQIRKKLNEKT